MRGNVGLLARLELRHARSDLRFLLFAAGADIDEDRGFLERTYQLYLVALFALALVLSWAQVVDLVEGARDALGSLAGSIAFALLSFLPAVLLMCCATSGLQETPLRLTLPDISWLARVVRPEEILAVRLVRVVALWLFAGALGGHVLGVLAGAYEPLAWPRSSPSSRLRPASPPSSARWREAPHGASFDCPSRLAPASSPSFSPCCSRLRPRRSSF